MNPEQSIPFFEDSPYAYGTPRYDTLSSRNLSRFRPAGVRSAVLEALAAHGAPRCQVELMGIPDRFVELLNRPVTNFWAVRDGKDWQWPPASGAAVR